jgi:transcriptional regulator with XRE-family HTH domain
MLPIGSVLPLVSGIAFDFQKMVEKLFGKVLRQIREDKKMTQEKLAELAEVDRTYIWRLESGRRSPSLSMIFKLADAFKMTPGNLVDKVNKLRSS